MIYTLENEFLTVKADTSGAELTSICSKKDNTEYLWQADERYWKRHAPVLFPIVGSLAGKRFLIGGREYPMGQHGFARDMEFTLIEKSDGYLKFSLSSDAGTKERYPYDFRLDITYILSGSSVATVWEVTNTGAEDLHYQIGGHPAFNCPLYPGQDSQSDYYLLFDSTNPINYGLLNGNGLLEDTVYSLATDEGYCRIADDMFDKDALIVEGSQSKKVSLCLPDKKPYLSVSFDAPLYGLWSPTGKHAPFVCIEPWYGRADRAGFAGDISEREYDQCLTGGESKEYAFTIEIL